MSRLIVKNLPNKITVESLKEIFEQKGEVTDVQLKYTKDGKFRNFGFIGYRTEEQAASAKDYFDGTCIRSMKIQVQVCSNLGDEKPRAWSKYAPDSTAYKKIHKDEIKKENITKLERKTEKNKKKIKALLKKHKDDPLFAEFIAAHVNDKTYWIKETFEEVAKSNDDDSNLEEQKTKDDIDENNVEVKLINQTENKKVTEKVANKQISDLEYMELLMKKVGDSENQQTEEKAVEEEKPKKVRNRPLFYVKIMGLPFKCTKKDIKQFFRPLVPFSIRLPLSKGKKLAGFCYAGFRTEKELKTALTKDKLFIGNHRVHVYKYEDKAKRAIIEEEQNIKRKKQEKENIEESVGESGRIFVRNLPYIVSETEVTNLFEKYGPVADINMPVDAMLNQPKGFATVTFVMPEHAVKAYTELDGTVFCGRMLHLLPAKDEKLEDESGDEGLSFKEKKAKKLKAQAKSSHNWNLLFLGSNAVADVVAKNFDTTKEELLTDNSKNATAAVKMALGETQLVAETRTFLEKNGVYLDAFNRPSKRKSKTCMIIKNLPANTELHELKALFDPRHIARLLMPKHGITALVDFIEPHEAKKAFFKLAYSQFNSSPLYLEWAPENVFIKSAEYKNSNEIIIETTESEQKSTHKEIPHQNDNDKVEDKKVEIIEESIIEPEMETTLFVKNLNFKTSEEALKEHFARCGKLYNVTIAKKKDPKNPGQFLSMGYGFIQFYTRCQTNEALKLLQNSTLDDKTLELKRSERENTNQVKTSRKTSKETKTNGTKILVRNVPFQANRNELHEIFRTFGEIKTLRLPKKLSPGSEQHRGFAFVDYQSKNDAKTAFGALCQSTHLYGRRLVLEWADEMEEENTLLKTKRKAETFLTKTPGSKKSRKGTIDAETFVNTEIKENDI